MSITVDVHCRGDEGNDSSTSADENRILTASSFGEDEISCLPSVSQEGHTSLSRITPYKSAQRRWSLNFSRTRKPVRSATVPLVQTKKFRLSIDDQVHQKYENIQQITQDFEGHQDLMEDSDFAKAKRDEIIRSLPQALSMKKEIRENLARTIRRRSSLVEDSFWKDCADNWKLFFVRVQMWYQLVNRLEIWYNALKEVEGFFGSSVGSYFKFLRFLFALNVVAAILVTGFIMLPQIMFNWSAEPALERHRPAMVDNFTDVYKEMQYTIETDSKIQKRMAGRDLISGSGAMTGTTFFYGSYTNETFSLTGHQPYYSMPNAFVIVIIVVYALVFLILSVSVGRSYRHSFIESSGSVHKMFSHKILCAWDFGISNTKAAGMKRQAILNEFREMLHEANVSYVTRATKCHRIWTISTQIAAHALCIFMLAGLAVGLWTILTDDLPVLCLLINVTLTIYQNMFRFISKLEEYKSPGTILHIHLLRNFLLEATIIGVLLFYWINETTQSCWETKVGQEIYRIVVSDLILTLMVAPAYYGGRYLLHRNFSDVFDLPHFDISHACLKLVFNQTLMWIGVVYAPVLPILMVAKMVVLFYLKKFVLLRFCKPPEKLWRSSQTQTTFMVLTFLSLFAVTVTNGYIAVQVPISPNCGPFRGYTHMFDIIASEIDDLKQSSVFWSIVASLTKPAVVAGILLSMSVIVYYLRARSRAHIAMVKLLKEMLYLEGKDKEFLLNNIKRLTQDAGFFFDDSEVVFKRHRRMASGDWMFKSQRSAYNIGLNNNNNEPKPVNGKAKLV